MAAGPLLGGALVALANWRAVFAVNVVIGIPAALWSIFAMPAVVRRTRRLDLAGMGTATVLIGGLVFALIEAPALGAHPAVVAAAALAVAGLVGFVWVERSTPDPLLPRGVYTDRGFVMTAIQGGLLNFAFYGVLFALSLMLQQGRGLSALTTGLLFLPLTGLITAGNVFSAPMSRRFGRGAVLVTGQVVLALALFGLVLAGRSSALWPLILALLPVGLSSGLLVPTMTAQSIAAVEPPLHGAASAAFNTSRQIGGAIGVATFGPLLGSAHNLTSGFVTGVVVAAAASVIALLPAGFGAVTRRTVPRQLEPSGLVQTRNFSDT